MHIYNVYNTEKNDDDDDDGNEKLYWLWLRWWGVLLAVGYD
jgi:hypothetical protein